MGRESLRHLPPGEAPGERRLTLWHARYVLLSPSRFLLSVVFLPSPSPPPFPGMNSMSWWVPTGHVMVVPTACHGTTKSMSWWYEQHVMAVPTACHGSTNSMSWQYQQHLMVMVRWVRMCSWNCLYLMDTNNVTRLHSHIDIAMLEKVLAIFWPC